MERAERSEDGRIGSRAVEDIAETVAATDGTDAGDPEEIAATLRGVAADGVLTGESVDSAMAHLSKVVSTPATRVELSGMELDSAREDATEMADVPSVAARLDGFAARVGSIESDVETLDADLRNLIDRAEDTAVPADPSESEGVELYRIAAEDRRIHAEATRLQGEADELTTEIESFGRWIARPSVRHDELRTDVEELTAAVGALEDDAASLADAVDAVDADDAQDAADADEANDASDADGDDGVDDTFARTWFDCTLRRRVLELQAADLRAAAADVATVDERLGAEPEAPAHEAVRDLTADLEDRLAATADRLDELARQSWHDRYDRNLRAIDEDMATVEPPVEWGSVLTALEEARAS
ncbi:hypothetical protein [Halobaculum magnesiiphilum]|uniref:Halo transducer protein n=1 Tax=Halobaculum magnesiiphilum TaxID=1017351 RepID=A0A8T8WBQ4_9EURY|nr:hypothetical protein [Halobaculum magnesiiphilum]QZP37269.1 hypothetical protein K6T50_13425 [Halobaculum magnesiiphilum]